MSNQDEVIEGDQLSAQSPTTVPTGELWRRTSSVVRRHPLFLLLTAVAVLVSCVLAGACLTIWNEPEQVCYHILASLGHHAL